MILIILIIGNCDAGQHVYNVESFYENTSSPIVYSGATFLTVTVLSLLPLSFINRIHCWVSFSGWSIAYNETFGQGTRGMYLYMCRCTRTVTFWTTSAN